MFNLTLIDLCPPFQRFRIQVHHHFGLYLKYLNAYVLFVSKKKITFKIQHYLTVEKAMLVAGCRHGYRKKKYIPLKVEHT